MTTTTIHTATATVQLVPAVPLQVVGGQVTLDEDRAPYVEASVVAAIPAGVALIDPRGTYAAGQWTPIRVTLTLSRQDVAPAGPGQSRTFDLVLHERNLDTEAGTLTLVLRSDEALLIDAGRVATAPDNAAVLERQYTSLRTMVESVLTQHGRTLTPITAQPDAAYDADYQQHSNIALNPRANASWEAHSDLTRTLLSAVQRFSNRPGVRGLRATGTAPVAIYPLRGAGLSGLVSGVQHTVKLRAIAQGAKFTVNLRAHRSSDNAILAISDDYQVGLVRPVFMELDFIPTDASPVYFSAVWSGGANGQGLIVGDLLVSPSDPEYDEDVVPETYFDGSTVDNAEYTHQWTGEVNASTSWRFATYNKFTWAPGVVAWDYLAPLVEAAGLRLFCDEGRVWRLVDPATYTVAGTVTVAAGTNLTRHRDRISRAGEWYDSIVVRYDSTNAKGQRVVEYDIAVRAGATGTRTLLKTWDRKKPKDGAAAAILTRTQRRGLVVDVEALSDYTVTPGKALTINQPDGTTASGTVSRVTWRLASEGDTHGTMAVGSRGLV